MPVINEELKEYLDLKFGNVISEIKGTSKEHSEDIAMIDKRVEGLEIFKKSHEKDHEKAESKKRWSLGQYVSVILCLLVILADKFL